MTATTTPADQYRDEAQVAIADEDDLITTVRLGDLRAALAYYVSAADYMPDSVAGNLGITTDEAYEIGNRIRRAVREVRDQ